MSKKSFIRGTAILTCTGFISRIIGFFYRIFLSHTIGAQGLGLYQLVLPVQNIASAITGSGIQTALSRLIASRLALGKRSEAQNCFLLGTASAFLLSAAVSALIYRNSLFVASELLKTPETATLIRILALSFPLNTVHTCINSYYFAKKNTVIPSGLQLLEQIVRVGSSCLIYLILVSKNVEVTAVIAAGGALASEVAVSLSGMLLIGTVFTESGFSLKDIRNPAGELREIFGMSLPLTLNRLLITLLGSMEMVLIPQQLMAYGLDQQAALSLYGTLTGMALPLILFPSAVTNSASVLLMPSVAEMQALGYRRRIRHVTGQSLKACILLGSFCFLGFFFFGPFLGRFLFHSPEAGTYIRTLAFICPFLYMNTALTGILHGLGKNGVCLIHSASGILLRILFVIFAIPVSGIRGYMYGILFSELLLSILHLTVLYRYE